ncbi:ABC transporter ATP-binding protein [Nocardiopsis changdeensis]|uniref:ABC transporter ATP-binding protein n=1 Tax=Nocardiopsis TaxID=2013 RepID=UPI002104638D|nr:MULTISPECIES: ABC transporter ATP-binding protein [Nocardiopsis]
MTPHHHERTPVRLTDRDRLHRSPATTAPRARPLVEFHDVSHTPLLSHLDLTVHPGEHVALIGLPTDHTTTLTDLLTGHTTPTHGRITTHTTPHIHTSTPHTTLAHTITGHPDPDPHDPHLHTALAHAHLPTTPTTPLSDLPTDLTHRLHTARTHYADLTHHHLLVLTHPAPGEHLTPTPTTGLLQLTDRPTHTRTADRILLLHRGRVTETGTHHQLLVRGGAYARLYALRGTHRNRPYT